jgi:signal transduction histidine kinase
MEEERVYFMQEVNDSLSRIFLNGSEMGKRILEHHWTNTPLGPIEKWPQSLITSLSLILNAHQPMWIAWGPELIFFYNDVYIPVLSLSKHAWALGKPTSEVWAEVWNECGPLIDNVLNKGEPCFFTDMRLFINRGDFLEETFFSFSYNPIQDATGKVVGLFCPCNDVSQGILNTRRINTISQLSVNVLAEKKLKSACITAMNSLANNTDDVPFAGLYLVNEHAKSAKLEKMVGISNDFQSLFPLTVELEDSHTLENSLWPIMKAYQSLQPQLISIKHVESLPLGLAGQRLSECLILPLIQNTQAKPSGILIVGVNPTRRLDNDYQTFYNLVANHFASVIQRAKILEEEIQHTEKLKEIDHAKTVFFSNISHEFRTPLTLMLAPLEDLLTDIDTPLSPPHRQKLSLAHRNTYRLLKLVNTLLDFSRIEAHKLQAIFEPTDLTSLTEDLASMFRTTIEKAGLQFTVDATPLKESVYIDKEMWEKIIFNLLSNAFKYTLEGSIKLSLRKEDHCIKLVVKDTGIGIPASELPRLFERFHRVIGAKGRSFEGSGIGLALTQDLVKLHGGNIEVNSEENVGSVFTVTLLLGSSHLPKENIHRRREQYKPISGTLYINEAMQWVVEDQSQKKEVLTPKNTTLNKNKLQLLNADKIKTIKGWSKILVVDDNPDMRKYISSLLNLIAQVELAEDGEEAWRSIIKNPPDLILSDVMMPKMNGFELVQKIRHDPQLKLIPMILLSARAGEEARIEGIQSGADDYLVKPFSSKELVARVNTQLELGLLRINLEDRVKQRTHELQNAYETLNREMLERVKLETNLYKKNTEINLIKEYSSKQIDFINFICHEIRNSLTVIYGATSLLQTEMLSVKKIINNHAYQLDHSLINQLTKLFAQICANLDSLEQSSQQQKIIVDDVLDMAKLEYDKIELYVQSFSLQTFFNNLKKMFGPRLDKKQLTFILNLPETEVWIEADSYRLSQVITNLMTNAIKFTEKGEIIITANVVSSTEKGSQLSIIIEDTGVGMNDAELSRLFTPFTQANAQTASLYGGSGLGLVICKKLIGKMGGKIQVESIKGQGTRFLFSIKCNAVERVM